jgi:PAS domain S-box-containing protein
MTPAGFGPGLHFVGQSAETETVTNARGSKSSRRPPHKSRKTTASTLFFNLMDSVHVPMLIFSDAASQPYLVSCNEAALHLLGYDRPSINKIKLTEIFHEAEYRRVQAITSILSEPTGHRLIEETEMQAVKKSGRKVWVKVTASSLHDSADPETSNLIVLSLSDLTEQKQLQADRENALKEVLRISKLADIGQLVAGVAHEINNPLTIVQGFAENIELLLQTNNLQIDEIRLQLDLILKATDRMAKIISRMMRMVRQDDFHMTLVDLRDVVSDAIHFMHHRFDDFSIEVDRSMMTGCQVQCDPNQIEQILLNLFSNAIHALRKNTGERRLRIVIEADEYTVHLKIHNNGPPIPAEIRDRIMSPFFTTKPAGEGTGLGLALSYGIMKAHGGDLTFTSSRKDGTEFVLVFPAVAATADETTRATPGRMVMVADENDVTRNILVSKLQRYGYQVFEAKDGETLIAQLTSLPAIEGVFVDLYLPRTAPAQIIPAIRHAVPKALVYVLTDNQDAQAEKKSERLARRQGVHGFLSKAIDQEQFASIIRLLEGSTRHAA